MWVSLSVNKVQHENFNIFIKREIKERSNSTQVHLSSVTLLHSSKAFSVVESISHASQESIRN